MTLPNIVEESQKLFELLQNCKDPLSLGHELKSLQRQFEATHRLLIVRGIDIPKVENKPLTLISPTNFEASEEARQIYEFLFYKASELGNSLHLLTQMSYYQKFLKISDEILGDGPLTQLEIDMIFHPEWFEDENI